jgi:hypothetical protein
VALSGSRRVTRAVDALVVSSGFSSKAGSSPVHAAAALASSSNTFFMLIRS